MRWWIFVLAVCLTIEPSRLPCQAVELGLFGSAARRVARETSGLARITVFVTSRAAIELQQDVASVGRMPDNGGLWGLLVVPVGDARVHIGTGIQLRPTESKRPDLELGPLLGVRLKLHDWLGVRADAQMCAYRLNGGSDTACRGVELLGGLSLRFGR
jgi:hypothetical protein